ncbi:MAG: hypothetical protein PGN08_12005 [Sphingomonas taxi]
MIPKMAKDCLHLATRKGIGQICSTLRLRIVGSGERSSRPSSIAARKIARSGMRLLLIVRTDTSSSLSHMMFRISAGAIWAGWRSPNAGIQMSCVAAR